jgi:PAS domain S-box-containing protein
VAGQLTRSEQRLRRILDTIPAMIAYVDAGQRYRFANRGYADWFGLDQQRIAGRSILEVVGPEAYAQVQPHLEQAYGGEQVSYEYSRTNAAGQLLHARSAVVPKPPRPAACRASSCSPSTSPSRRPARPC